MPGDECSPRRSDTVAVTGLGAVSPFGWSLGSLWEGLRAGVSAIGPFDRFDHSGHRTHIAAQVDMAAQPARLGGRAARMSHADRFAVAAAREAAARACLDIAGGADRVGVYFGTCTGGMIEAENYFEALLAAAGKAEPPALRSLASQQQNGPGDSVARDLGVGGPVQSVSAACPSGAMAIGDAMRAVRCGEVDVAIAGGSDGLCRLTYAGFNALRAVDERSCRPFRLDRAGLSLGEGAAVIVLELLERALARGARPLAIASGEAASCDAHHMTSPPSDGAGAVEAIHAALSDARIDPDAIDFVNAHGTGTPLNDAAEAEALRAVFGSRLTAIPVTSTKALVGHLLGAAGALEAAATILCLNAREVHPMPDDGSSEPESRLRLVLGRSLHLPRARHALSTSLAFGGANAALIFTRHGEGSVEC